MKKVLFMFGLIIVLAGCEKEARDSEENECPVVEASAVPATVTSAFTNKYPSETVIKWFQKDNTGYCAYFLHNVNQRKLAEFSTSGTFISEEADDDHDGKFEDSTGTAGIKTPNECECEVGR